MVCAVVAKCEELPRGRCSRFCRRMKDFDAEARMSHLVADEMLGGISTNAFTTLRKHAISSDRFDAAAKRATIAEAKHVYNDWETRRGQQLVQEFVAHIGASPADAAILAQELRCVPANGVHIFVHEPNLSSVCTTACGRLYSTSKHIDTKAALAEDWARRHLPVMNAGVAPAITQVVGEAAKECASECYTWGTCMCSRRGKKIKRLARQGIKATFPHQAKVVRRALAGWICCVPIASV